ncbi:lysophospholipid acyltransferase family protein [Desulfosporosinus hippei]|uniref:1-acyl-sn-glycerol-3-phosphate acyltransferase n=1 Tax=Desulfosporosinus hippei DSM 8344 TaxID=1121419 RepID=A0A1G8FAL3_9FIRM|nr:lysophospholipid acyltransferase family protein [Desulfosporosinus hippei]SDH79194.1 1-acyl-sn-glycerol-3-phosphate acyltransferase [Desulfosporosinus hippei DSM 8344]
MKKNFFMLDSYHTAENTPRFLLDRLLINTRLFFMLNFFKIVLKSRSAAVKGHYDTEAWILSSYDIFKLIEGCGGRFHITGLDNLQKCKGPVVFISNHMSTLETMIFPCLIAPIMDVTFVVKDSLVEHPFFGPIISAQNPIVVSRKNSRADLQIVMKKGQELLANGISIVVFPQNTRTVSFVPKEFNSLGVKLASKAKVEVVPIAIKTDFWGNGKYLKDLGPINRKQPIHMAFGEPLSINGLGKEGNSQIIEFIAAHLEEWNKG